MDAIGDASAMSSLDTELASVFEVTSLGSCAGGNAVLPVPGCKTADCWLPVVCCCSCRQFTWLARPGPYQAGMS